VAFYGSATGAPARELFTKDDAEQALNDCRIILGFVESSRSKPESET
jgi:hypothetical protein